jgi:hypothetical protein
MNQQYLKYSLKLHGFYTETIKFTIIPPKEKTKTPEFKWIKSLIANKPEINKELSSKAMDNSDESKKQILKEFNDDRMKRDGFAKGISDAYATCSQPIVEVRTCTHPFQNPNPSEKFPTEIISETIHPVVNRKERFSSSHEKIVKLESTDTIFYLTEKQFMFYSVIKELTQEYGKARAKDICIRYVISLNNNIPEMEEADWMYKLSAHNKTMKFLLKSGLVIKLSKGYKAIK